VSNICNYRHHDLDFLLAGFGSISNTILLRLAVMVSINAVRKKANSKNGHPLTPLQWSL